jgi:alkanesulfonate monooxygenase SsuD/methylene tetrahydromethanopterin reductase-like flavin-dependent oxidoreductase (luciferase family)
MGASVIVYWPGITEEQLERQPGFWNDDRAWGNWMAEWESVPAVVDAVKKLKAEAILTYKTDGMDDEDVSWVSPQELRDAATTLRDAVLAGSAETRIILETYERNANRIDEVAKEFIRDLNDIITMTNWSEEEEATRITLEVNW